MKAGWDAKKLGEICKIKPSKKEAKILLKDDDLVSFVPMEDLGILTKDFIVKKERQLKDVFENYTYFSDNDVLLAKITPCFENGKVGIARNLKNKVGFGSSEFIVFRSHGHLIPDYLYYFLGSDEFRKKGEKVMRGAVGHKRVPKDFIENQEILFPKSFYEQRRIVAILDKAFAAIAKAKENAQKNWQNARELFQSYLQDVFDKLDEASEVSKLGKLSKINYGYTERASFNEIGPKFLRITDIQGKNVNWESVPFCKIDNKELSKYILNREDIVFARTGATTGKSYLIEAPPLAVFASYLIRVQILDPSRLTAPFLFLFFQTKTYWDNIKIGLSGSAQGGFNAKKLGELLIPFPPLPEQQRIVTKLDALALETKKLQTIYQQKLIQLEELKKSILHKAFNGELTDEE